MLNLHILAGLKVRTGIASHLQLIPTATVSLCKCCLITSSVVSLNAKLTCKVPLSAWTSVTLKGRHQLPWHSGIIFGVYSRMERLRPDTRQMAVGALLSTSLTSRNDMLLESS